MLEGGVGIKKIAGMLVAAAMAVQILNVILEP
jgi:hypothetical protein